MKFTKVNALFFNVYLSSYSGDKLELKQHLENTEKPKLKAPSINI